MTGFETLISGIGIDLETTALSTSTTTTAHSPLVVSD